MRIRIKRFFGKVIISTSILLLVTNTYGFSTENNSDQKKDILIGPNGKRTIQAVRITENIKIDGLLDDPAWQSVNFQGNFLQREPYEGVPATEKTEIGILYDQNNIYFGIKCFDSEPEKIIAREMRRDQLVDDDDNFEMVLDTYHDKRSAYYFITNPYGSKREAVFTNEGRDYNPNWDGVWWCKSSINSEGWFLEIAIPWKTLRFSEQDSSVWGFNCARKIRRKNEHVYWQLISRDVGRAGVFRVSMAGTLQGLTNLKMGGNLELKPYFLGGMENDLATDFATDKLGDIGLDAKVALTANLALDLTINTDFAQVESDQEQVNLTRFSLFYPEKREFFLEGGEIFTFGMSGNRHWNRGTTDMNLFHSRQIGIVDGHKAPIKGGAKMIGKIGNYRIGVMSIFTDEVSYTDEDSSSVKVNPTNFAVFRLSRDILERGSLGLIFLNKQETKSRNYNLSFGIDGNFPLSANFSISGYFSGTAGQFQIEEGQMIKMNTKNLASKLSLDYQSDLWQLSTSYQDIGARFNAEMGFNRRTDYRLNKASAEYKPRPENSEHIRQYGYKIDAGYRANHDNLMLDTEIGASYSIEFHNSSRFNVDIKRKKEFVDYDWEVREGFMIPTTTYTEIDYSMRIETDKSKPIAGEINLGVVDYYT